MAADAIPPQAQIETLKSFKRDIQMSVRTAAKGIGTQPVRLEELRVWLKEALVSPTDPPRPVAEGMGDGTEVWLSGADKKAALAKLDEKIDARIKALEAGKGDAVSTEAWAVKELAALVEKKAKISDAKSGATRVARTDEIQAWLSESGSGPIGMPRKKE